LFFREDRKPFSLTFLGMDIWGREDLSESHPDMALVGTGRAYAPDHLGTRQGGPVRVGWWLVCGGQGSTVVDGAKAWSLWGLS
jgi:hypothetical protein